MENPKTMMLAASIIGALAGIYYITSVKPLNNYFIFMALFAIIGIGAANMVLLALYEIYEWLRQYHFSNTERT